MNKKEILADLEQIKSSLEELETQRDDIQILCIKSELELSIENILSDYKRALKENQELKGDLKYVLNQTLGAFEKNWCIDWNFTEIREKYNLESE